MNKKTSLKVESELRQMLLLLAEELLVNGKGFGETAAELKWAYVQAATDSLAVRGRVSISAVAVMTGLDRHECQRIMRGGLPPPPSRGHSQRVGRVAKDWHQHPDYNPDLLDPPPSLPLHGEGSLEELIARSAGDVPWVCVKVALEEAGMLRIDKHPDGDRATLLPRPSEAEAQEDLARRLRAMSEVFNT